MLGHQEKTITGPSIATGVRPRLQLRQRAPGIPWGQRGVYVSEHQAYAA